jgi:hypothetical protein
MSGIQYLYYSESPGKKLTAKAAWGISKVLKYLYNRALHLRILLPFSVLCGLKNLLRIG